MAQLRPELPLETPIARLLESFAVDPADEVAFRTLEEHLSGAGDSQRLAGIYECRLAAVPPGASERAALLVRLARVLEEELGDLSGARRRYEEAIREGPPEPAVLASLRRLYVRAGDLPAALQVAETEEGLERPRSEQLQLLVDVADLWRTLGDLKEARRRVRDALKLDPSFGPALEVLAGLAEAEGRTDEAVRLLERNARELDGEARAEVLERVANLLTPDQEARAIALLREVVQLDPARVSALRRLLPIAEAQGDWNRAEHLARLLWRGLEEGGERAELALRTVELHLERTGNLDAAALWAARAAETSPEDPALQDLRVRLFRRTGQSEALIQALESLAASGERRAEVAFELAGLHEREGNAERAVEWGRVHLTHEPGDLRAFALLDRCLEELGLARERAELIEQRIELSADPPEEARLLVKLAGLRAGPLEDPAGAEEAYLSAMETDPDNPDAATGLEAVLREHRRGEELASRLEELAARPGPAPSRAHWWSRLGSARMELLDDAVGAQEAFRRALELYPRSTEALDGFREAARLCGDPLLRLEACERELALAPTGPRAAMVLSEGLEASLEAGDPLRACRLAAHWAEVAPGSEAFAALAGTARAAGDRDEERRALTALEPLLKEDPEAQATCLIRLSELELESQNPEALRLAAMWLEEAIGLWPNLEVRRRLAEIYRRAGLLPEVVRVFREGLEELPRSEVGVWRLELARALEQARDGEEAARVLWEAWDLAPETPGVADALESLLADLDRGEEVVRLLEQRLARETDRDRRARIATRSARLVLDELGRPEQAVEILRDQVEPHRRGRAEALYLRALEGAEATDELERWLLARAGEIEGPERVEILLRLASVQERERRSAEAIATLWWAERESPRDRRQEIRERLVRLLGTCGAPDAQAELLGRLLEEGGSTPANAELRLERARILSEYLGDSAQALEELERARTEGPLPLWALRLLAKLYHDEGRPRDQVRSLRELLDGTQEPEDRRSATLELATLLAKGPPAVRSPEMAAELLRELLATDPRDAEPFHDLVELLEAAGRYEELTSLLRERVSDPRTPTEERRAVVLRLARLESPGHAVVRLQALREQLGPHPAVDRALSDALRASGNLTDEECLARTCAEQAQLGSPERQHWLRRWAEVLEVGGAPAEALLEQVNAVLQEAPDEPVLLRKRLERLRRSGSQRALAEELDEALERPEVLSGSDRRRAVRDLVLLREGPLQEPERALDRLERELPADPGLAPLAARLATRIGDPERQIRVLRTLVLKPSAGFRAGPDQIRQLGLALFGAGEFDEAEPLLRRAEAVRPQDLPVVRALDTLARDRGDARERLRWLEARFPLEPRGQWRPRIAREGFTLSETIGDGAGALRWLRRCQADERLPEGLCFRWLELEREVGDRAGELRALRVAREQIENPRVRAGLIAREAELFEQSGEHGLARRALREAVRADRDPDPDLLRAWERVLRDPEHALERAAALSQLARHPSVSPEERIRDAAARAELLARIPEHREEAVREFRRLLDESGTVSVELELAWGRALLGLYRTLGREPDWCDVAERLLGLLPDDERTELARTLARKLAGPLGARHRAIACWEQVLELEPLDEEALRALADLLHAPGHEARRATVLEELANTDARDAPKLLVEAARARWTVLGDASAALEDLDRALGFEPGLVEAHELRQELCAFLDRPEEEAESLRALLTHEGEGPSAAEQWLRIAQLLARQETRKPEARDPAERALALAPTNPGVRRAVRSLLERIGDWDRVAGLLREEAAQADAGKAAILVRRLARVEWQHRHDADRACQALEALSQIEPLTGEDRELWANALGTLGRWREALSLRAETLELQGRAAPAEAWLELADSNLARLDDPVAARAACEAAMRCDPGCVGVLRLLADLDARLGNTAGEIAHREALARRLFDGAEASHELARAAHVAREQEGDVERARILLYRALRRDPGCPSALLDAGKLASERGDWEEAERCLARAYPLLAGTRLAAHVAEAARGAARAAAELGKESDVLAHLEVALAERPDDPETLDLGASLALRVGAWQKARELLEARLSQSDIDARRRAERLALLARAQASLGNRAASAESLEQAVTLRPEDEAMRARLVDLLEELDQHTRAVEQLDGWIAYAPPDARPELALRAARIELHHGDRGRALERLERIAVENPEEAGVWRELGSVALEEAGPEAALARISQALEHVGPIPDRAPLLTLRAQALRLLGRRAEAAGSALEALEADPGDTDAARCLVVDIGYAGDWSRAVRALNRTLDVACLTPTVEAELWDAVGRAYAAPLQNLTRAQRAYRRALAANPESDRAREALADVTSFDPDSHGESLCLHAELLARFPGRRASWRALERISEHRRWEEARRTARWVLCALEGEEEQREATDEARAFLAELRPSSDAEAVAELVREMKTGKGALPESPSVPSPPLPPAARFALAALAGPAWSLANEKLSQLAAGGMIRTKSFDRGARRRFRGARSEAGAESVGRFDAELWRAELMGVAAARAAASGALGLREALEALLRVQPETTGMEVRATGGLGEASQLCPPARLLLLRIAQSIAGKPWATRKVRGKVRTQSHAVRQGGPPLGRKGLRRSPAPPRQPEASL